MYLLEFYVMLFRMKNTNFFMVQYKFCKYNGNLE